jgi:hypothetical protein
LRDAAELKPRDAADWSRAARPLADWTGRLLVNRRDAWGGYRPLALRADGGKSITKPARADRGKHFLTLGTLERHFRGERPEDVCGLHSTSPDSFCRWGAADIDRHGGGADPAANTRAALGWYARLAALGFRPLLTGSDGRGGYHLRAIFDRPIPSERVYALMHWLTADYAAFGLDRRPEVFPKQARLDAGAYGNWLRLVGRHHTSEYWSKVWDGARVLAGAAAVDFILSLTGDDPGLIPAGIELPRPRVAVVPRVVRPYWAPPGDALARRVRDYARKVGNRGVGGRSNAAYDIAAFATRDLAMSEEDAMPLLVDWDRCNMPPLGDDELAGIVANAQRYGKHDRGCGLVAPPPVRATGPKAKRRHRSHSFTVMNGGAL